MEGSDGTVAETTSVLPEYRSSVFIDGYTYKISVQLPAPEQAAFGMVPHSHSRFELHAIAKGSATLEFVDQPDIHLEAGACGIIPPNVYHLRRIGAGAPKCFVMFISCPKGAPLQLSRVCRLDCAEELIPYFCRLEEELSIRRIGSDNTIQCLFTMLLVTVLRELATLPERPRLPVGAAVRQREDLMDNYFALHYSYEVSAQDLADRIGVTTRQLARIMQQRYGCTFRQRLLEIRLYHARNYLTTTDVPICRIAAACGFESQGAFATAFRKHVGCSPTQYRRQKGE